MNFVGGDIAQRYGAHTIGVRPEHLEVTQNGGEWGGRVGVSEHLGSDTFLHIHEAAGATGEATITARVDGEFPARHGDAVYLSPQPDKVHRFDANGLRM